jgi:hypothetical protein
MSNLTPQVQVAMLCSHSDGESCASTEAGHTVSALRRIVSAATPSKWRDGIVTGTSSDSPEEGSRAGWLRIDLLEPSGPAHTALTHSAREQSALAHSAPEQSALAHSAREQSALALSAREQSADGEAGTVWVWNHSDLSTLLRAGEPVALHALYGILAVGAERFSVIVA